MVDDEEDKDWFVEDIDNDDTDDDTSPFSDIGLVLLLQYAELALPLLL